MGRHAFALALALLVGACKTAPIVAPLAVPHALAPLSAVGARSASQVIHVAYGARALTLRTAIEVSAAGLTVIGVSATGQRLFTASYDGKTISASKSPFVPAGLDPERVLADMQLALWPLHSVQSAFAERGIEISEPFAGVRRALRGDELIAEVHYASDDPWHGRLWLVNLELRYTLTIDTTTAN